MGASWTPSGPEDFIRTDLCRSRPSIWYKAYKAPSPGRQPAAFHCCPAVLFVANSHLVAAMMDRSFLHCAADPLFARYPCTGTRRRRDYSGRPDAWRQGQPQCDDRPERQTRSVHRLHSVSDHVLGLGERATAAPQGKPGFLVLKQCLSGPDLDCHHSCVDRPEFPGEHARPGEMSTHRG